LKIWTLLRAAVVGGGVFGEAHLRTLGSVPLVEVAGIYTLEKERGETLAARYGGKNFQSMQEICADPTIDIVTIATPEDRHYEPFRILAEAGEAIYVEKPLASNLSEAAGIRELSQSVFAMSGHCLRFEQRISSVMDRLKGVCHHDYLGSIRLNFPALSDKCYPNTAADAFRSLSWVKPCGST
jgi:predicted dehydrogenase